MKLLAVDLDGTLLREDGTIDAGDRSAVAAAQERGVQVVIATGRAFRGSVLVARDLGLHGPIIVTTGGQIIDIDSESTLDERRLDQTLARGVLAFCRERGYAAAAFDALGRDVRWVAAPPEWGWPTVVDPELPERLARDPEQVVVVGEEAVRAVMDHFPAAHVLALPDAVHPRAAHVLHPEATKGRALLRLAARLGLPPSAVAAVGDSMNDLSMIAAAGCGFCMAGAPPAVAAVARAEVRSVAEAIWYKC